MARAKKTTAPTVANVDTGVVEVLYPETVIVNAPPAATPPPEAKPTRKPRAKQTPAKPKESKPPAQKKDAPKPTAPDLGFAELLRDSENLRAYLAEAKQHAEEAGRQFQLLKQQHDEFRRELEGLRRQASDAGAEARAIAESVRAPLEEFRLQLAEASEERRESVAASARATRLIEESGEAVHSAGRQLVADLEGLFAPVRRALQEVRPDLEALPAHSRQTMATLSEIATALPEVANQVFAIEQVKQESQIRLAAVLVETEEAERLSLARREAREAEESLLRELELQRIEERRRLDAAREETIAEEARLATLLLEVREAESRLEEIRQERIEAEPPPAPAEEVVSNGHGEPGRGRLGVTVESGVVVAEVQPDSPAQTAGLAVGDLIESINGTPVKDCLEARKRIQNAVDGRLALNVVRGDEELMLTAQSAKVEVEGEERPWLGLTVDPIVRVAELVYGSPAEVAGLAAGDVIRSVNGVPVHANEELVEAVLWETWHQTSESESDAVALTLEVSRAGRTREVEIPLAAPALAS